ncbi:MAG: type II toxin-antitoxin system PemK/MazF family toxin [Betaproteobacteria bacterium]
MSGASTWTPDSGDIIWLNFSPHAGREMAGQQPFLVLSTKEFNRKTKTVIGLAMTSKPHNEPGVSGFNPFQMANQTSKAGPSFINTNQVSTFDWEARGAAPHPWGRVNKLILQTAKEYLNSILSLA